MGTSVEDNIRCILLVLARGLKNNFSNILKGNIEWIDDYKKSHMFRDIRRADKIIVELIEN